MQLARHSHTHIAGVHIHAVNFKLFGRENVQRELSLVVLSEFIIASLHTLRRYYAYFANENPRTINMQSGDPDPDRHLKRLQRVFGVSTRIQDLAIRRHVSPRKITKEEAEREQLANSKDMRKKRQAILQPPHRFVLEVVGEHYGLECDPVEAGVLDDDQYVRLLDEFVQKEGRMAILFFYDDFSHPAVGESSGFVFAVWFCNSMFVKQ